MVRATATRILDYHGLGRHGRAQPARSVPGDAEPEPSQMKNHMGWSAPGDLKTAFFLLFTRGECPRSLSVAVIPRRRFHDLALNRHGLWSMRTAGKRRGLAGEDPKSGRPGAPSGKIRRHAILPVEGGHTAMVQDVTADEALRKALRQQADGETHDRSLIVERLSWTPAQRLEANAAFLRFYFRARPDGPLLRDA